MPIKNIIPNLLGLGILLILFVLGRTLNVPIILQIFKQVDQLTGNIILVVIAIAIGIFMKDYWYVFGATLVATLVTLLVPAVPELLNTTQEYIFAFMLVILGFSSISNFSRQYR